MRTGTDHVPDVTKMVAGRPGAPVRDGRAWPLVRLGEVARFHNGRAFKPAEWKDTGIPIIRIQNLNTPDAHYNCFDGDIAPEHAITIGDLLVSWSASLDAYIWRGPDAALNQHIFKVEENPSLVDRLYLYYVLREKMSEIRERIHGATMKHITKPEFLACVVPLPPLDEQRRIAARLDEQMAHAARARAAAEEHLRLARSLLPSILREVFSPATPNRWPLVRLGEVCHFIRGVSFKKHEVRHDAAEGFVPVLRAGNIDDTLNVADDLVWIPDRKVASEQLLRLGDIAICMSSGSPAVVGKTAALQQHWTGTVGAFCGIIRPRANVDPEYLALWLRSADFIEWRDLQARGANIQNLRFSQLSTLEIPLPLLGEQRRIAAELSRRLASVERLAESIRAELAALDALPGALLRGGFGRGGA